MAQEASDSSSSRVYSPFDVFINHRGTDVKKNLASHLYSRLKEHGLRVFLDAGELIQGDQITSQIQGAIRTASVHVAIFSSRYAESSWCVNELVMMLESGSTILPVFYDVNPADLRWTRGEDGVFARALTIIHCIFPCIPHEDGVYAKALRILEKKATFDSQTNKQKLRYDSSTIEKWRKVLSEVSHISGFKLEACNGDEGHLADQIVQQVLKKVSKTPLNVGQYPTGLEDKVNEFETTMLSEKQSGKARVVGIVGLGGVGKSTLAKEFFNRHRSNYDRSCFLYDVREIAAKNSLNSLQAILLKDLGHLNEQINGVNEGIDKLESYLSSSYRALIVLDDVDGIKQMEALFSPVKDIICAESLILVTSRNKDVLISSGISESAIYRLTGLNRHYSRMLFCSHAFGQSHSVEGFDKVIDEYLDACQGLPLSLKVVGALLRAGKGDLNHWKSQLRKISKILPNDIQSTLKISYDSLDEWEKQIFLDIACFFIGEKRDTAIRIWDGSDWEGSLGLWKLENRCLVDFDSKNCIRMHDHLRDLGRHLAEKEHLGSRLWQPTDKLLHYLSAQSPVRGISMVQVNDLEQSFRNLAGGHLLTNMSSLQLLRAEGYFVEHVFSVGDLSQLIYLRWDNCPSSSLPFSNPLMNLRVLYLEGKNLETLWKHESQAPLQLRELNIYANLLKIIPNSIGKLKHLEKIALHANDLETLADSIGNLTSLQSIDLGGCSNLRMLPYSVGKMTSLQSLYLCGCSVLQMLPDSVGKMTSLRSLDLSECIALQMLPASVGKMTSLQTLSLRGCAALQMLPESVGEMKSLQNLDLSECVTLQMLPDSVGEMMSLQKLYLGRCSALQMLPTKVGKMTGLQSLDLRWCSALKSLPFSVGEMTSLQRLQLGGCSDLQMLPASVGKMMSLQRLVLSKCHALRELPKSVGEMTSLQILYLGECRGLQNLPDSIGKMTSLKHLDLSYCSALQMLPDSVGEMTSLESLCLSQCSHLKMLPDSVGKMTNLQRLSLGGCSALQMLPDSVGEMTSLQSLHLDRCSTLQMLSDSVREMTSLQRLDLSGCSSLQMFPASAGKMRSLQSLNMSECLALHMLPGSVGEMTNLQSLYLDRCFALQMLPDSVGGMTSLQSLYLNRCSTLQTLPDSVGGMTSLQRLHLRGCSALQMLPSSIGKMTSLQILDLGKCISLQMLPDSVGQLTSLLSLDLGRCSALQMLPDSVWKMTSLQTLALDGCSALQMLPDSVGKMTSLQRLSLGGWSALQKLPDSFGEITSLRFLYLHGCSALQILPASVGKMTSLQSIYLGRCSALQMLPGSIGEMTSLQSLDLSECIALQKLPVSVAKMRSLQSLRLHGCTELEELPGVERLSSLKELDVSGCSKLQWSAGVVEQLRQRLKWRFIE